MKLDKTQQNSKCRKCDGRNETINHIISNCTKLAQNECQTWQNRVEKVIHGELCKKQKFDHSTKWYMHKPESILENEMHKILWDFEIQTAHLIPARRPDLVLISNAEWWTLLS